MANQCSNFGALLKSLAIRNGYTIEYSEPELVTGSLCPPPSRHYPGTTCYMTFVTVNRRAYLGFGPTCTTARKSAEFEAYNALHPLPVEEVERVRRFIPQIEAWGESESEASDNEGASPSLHSTYNEKEIYCDDVKSPRLSQGADVSDVTENNCTQLNCDTHTCSRSADSRNDTGAYCTSESATKNVVSNQQIVSAAKERHSKEEIPQSSSTVETQDKEVFWEIPQSSQSGKYNVPKNTDEMIAMLEKPPSDDSGLLPEAFTFTRNRGIDVVDMLLEEAKQRGVSVAFQSRTIGPSYSKMVVVRAIGGGKQCEGRHRRMKVAKALAADKLLQELQKVPMHRKIQGNQHEKNRERPASCMPEFLPVPMQSDDTTSSTNSVTPYPISSDEVSLNPVSQLHELLMKELNTLPVYAERVSAVGKYTEYECVVSGVGLSAKGVGSSKKLARRHASENLLARMEEEGMNTDPSLIKPKRKKSLSGSRKCYPPRSRCVTPMPAPSCFPPPRFNPPPPSFSSPHPFLQHPMMATPPCSYGGHPPRFTPPRSVQPFVGPPPPPHTPQPFPPPPQQYPHRFPPPPDRPSTTLPLPPPPHPFHPPDRPSNTLPLPPPPHPFHPPDRPSNTLPLPPPPHPFHLPDRPSTTLPLPPPPHPFHLPDRPSNTLPLPPPPHPFHPPDQPSNTLPLPPPPHPFHPPDQPSSTLPLPPPPHPFHSPDRPSSTLPLPPPPHPFHPPDRPISTLPLPPPPHPQCFSNSHCFTLPPPQQPSGTLPLLSSPRHSSNSHSSPLFPLNLSDIQHSPWSMRESPLILSSDTDSELDSSSSQIVSEGLSEVLPPETTSTATPVPFNLDGSFSPETSAMATPVPFRSLSPETSTTATPVPFSHDRLFSPKTSATATPELFSQDGSPCEMHPPTSSFSNAANQSSVPIRRNCRRSLLQDGTSEQESSTCVQKGVQIASKPRQSLQESKNYSRDLESSVSQLAISVREYVGRVTSSTSSCSAAGGGQPVTAKEEERESVLQPSSNGSEGKGPMTKAQTSVSRASMSSSKMWIPNQLLLTSLTPNHTMHYSDPLNFTVRLPKERATPWSKPPNLHKDAVRQRSALPPWAVKRPTVNTTISQRPQLLSQENMACPELPLHPLLCRRTAESSTDTANDKPHRDSVSVSPSKVHNVRRLKAEFTIKNVFSEGVSDFEDELHFGLAGPGLPTQGSLEAMQQVLK